MEIKHPPALHCVGCGQPVDVEQVGPDVFEAQCHECKAIYRLRVATYRQATQ